MCKWWTTFMPITISVRLEIGFQRYVQALTPYIGKTMLDILL